MKISIIIPIYNVEEYLPRCIESVLAQKNIDLEVLLINDGSTDGSGDLCNDYAKKDDRIKVFHQVNSGVSSARNSGIKYSTGDWICFVDADDWIERDSLSIIINEIGSKEIDFIIARSYINRNGMPIIERYPFGEGVVGEIFKGTDLFIQEGYSRGSVWGVIYRRLFLMQNELSFPLKLKNGEDSIFCSLCAIYAENVSFLNIHLYNVFEREGSASRSWSLERIMKMVENINYLYNYIDSHPSLTKDGLDILNYAIYRVVSNIFYNFQYLASIKNYFKIRNKIKRSLRGKIYTGNITENKTKVMILNVSIDLFALLVLSKNKMSR